MLTTVFLSALLMQGGLGGLAASDLRVYGKSVHHDKTYLSRDDGRHAARRQTQQQTKSESLRSMDLESLNMHLTPTISKISLPTITKLRPPTAVPLHMHVNMPMRFGREREPDEDKARNSPNMPQRFGRSREASRPCAAGCPEAREAPKSAQELGYIFWRNSLYWSLLKTLASR